MNNKWIRLALLSFTGILISIFALGIVSSLGLGSSGQGMTNHGTVNASSNSGTTGQTQFNMGQMSVNGQMPMNGQMPNTDLSFQLQQLQIQVNQLQNLLNQYVNSSMGTMNNMNNNSNNNMSSGSSMGMM